jgi:hypothetical protein
MDYEIINKTDFIKKGDSGQYKDYINFNMRVLEERDTATKRQFVVVAISGTYLGGYNGLSTINTDNIAITVTVNGVTSVYNDPSTFIFIENQSETICVINFSQYNVDYSSGTVEVSASLTSDTVSVGFEETVDLIETDVLNQLSIFSEEDKTALKESTAIIRCRLVVKATGNLPEIVLTEEDAVKDWTYTDERYVPQQGFIGQFVARTLEGNLQNISDDFNIEGREIELQLGVIDFGARIIFLQTEDGIQLITEDGELIRLEQIAKDKTNWYSLGNFIVTNPEDNEVSDNTKFEAMDYAKLFNKQFDGAFTNSVFTKSYNEIVAVDEKGKPSGSVDALWLAKYTCAQVNIEFGQEYFTNSDFVIDRNPFQAGETCRDVMKMIAQLAFSWVRIDRDNKCYIDFGEGAATFSRSGPEQIDSNQYYTLETKKEIYGPINRVYMGMQNVDGESLIVAEDIASVEENGEHAIYIYDNPFTYTQELRGLIEQNHSADKLLGLTYSQLTTETVGHPWLKGNENIVVLDMENRSRNTFPFNRTITYAGYIKTTLDSMGDTQVEKTLGYKSEILNDIINAKITVDKATGEISLLSSRTQKLEDGTDDYYTKSQTNALINNAANGLTNVYTSAGGNNRFRNTGLYFPEGTGFEFWEGTATKIDDVDSLTRTAIVLHKNTFSQNVTNLPNGTYKVSFKYEKLIDAATCTVNINGKDYTLGNAGYFGEYSPVDLENAESVEKNKEGLVEINTNSLNIAFTCSVQNGYKIYELMCNVGDKAMVWTQHHDEIATDTVNISKGITITSTTTQNSFRADASGLYITNSLKDRTTEFTETGMITNEGTIRGNASITGVLFKKVGNQTWLTGA